MNLIVYVFGCIGAGEAVALIDGEGYGRYDTGHDTLIIAEEEDTE